MTLLDDTDDAAWWLARRKGLVSLTAADLKVYGPDPGRLYRALGLPTARLPVELACVDALGLPVTPANAVRRRFAWRPDLDGPAFGAWVAARRADQWAAWLVLAEAALRPLRPPDEYLAVLSHLLLAGVAGECEP